MNKVSIIRALRVICNSDALDLTINANTNNYGLRFYTKLHRIDAVRTMPKLIENEGLIQLNANILVPAGYDVRFDNVNNNTIVPVTEIVAIALVVKPEEEERFISDLIRVYRELPYPSESIDNSNSAIINYWKINGMGEIYNFGIDAMDRSNNPARGKLIVGDHNLVWIQATDTDTPPTFYAILTDKIPFIIDEYE